MGASQTDDSPAGSRLSALVDPALNAALIVLGILTVLGFIRWDQLRNLSPVPTRSHPAVNNVGRRISIEGIDWSQSKQTLVMFLNTNCGYCEKSEPLYRRLSALAGDHQKIRLIAVFPQAQQQAKQYLERASIVVDEIRQPATISDLKVFGTPTLFLVRNDGTVTSQWVGLLSPSAENDLVNSLTPN